MRRNLRGTWMLVLLGLLQGCAGSKHSVTTPAAQTVTSASEEDRARQEAVDRTARLAFSAASRDLTVEKDRPATTVAKPRATDGAGAPAVTAAPLPSRDAEALTDMGFLALQKGDLAAAEKALRAALAIEPNHPWATRHLAETLARKSRNEEAARMSAAPTLRIPSRPEAVALPTPPEKPAPPPLAEKKDAVPHRETAKEANPSVPVGWGAFTGPTPTAKQIVAEPAKPPIAVDAKPSKVVDPSPVRAVPESLPPVIDDNLPLMAAPKGARLPPISGADLK